MRTKTLIANARKLTAGQCPGWEVMSWVERAGKLSYYVEQLCAELEELTDPEGANARRKAKLEARLAALRDIGAIAGRAG